MVHRWLENARLQALSYESSLARQEFLKLQPKVDIGVSGPTLQLARTYVPDLNLCRSGDMPTGML